MTPVEPRREEATAPTSPTEDARGTDRRGLMKKGGGGGGGGGPE